MKASYSSDNPSKRTSMCYPIEIGTLIAANVLTIFCVKNIDVDVTIAFWCAKLNLELLEFCFWLGGI